MIRKIFDEGLSHHEAFENLHYLTKNIGHRVTGSDQADRAVKYCRDLMVQKSFDTSYLQPCQVRHWVRGTMATATLHSQKTGNKSLHICALGGSVPTNKKGISAKVIEVDSISDLDKLGRAAIEGKIIFFNRPMDPKFIRTFTAYGKAADQRVRGASAAAKYGAAGVIVRSLTLVKNNVPHTGILHYDRAYDSIPAVSVSTMDADNLHNDLIADPELTLTIQIDCSEQEKVNTFNAIGEIKGKQTPDEIILVGGHIDSWDVGEGAHDDGTGVMQSIEALRILQTIGYKPRHTLRCVAFMDEEMNQAGGRTYATWSEKTNQKHLAAIELDGGGAVPVGFSANCTPEFLNMLQNLKPWFLPYGIWNFQEGGGGVDISFLKKMNVPLISLSADSQRYFDYHHSALDVFEAVNEREMQMGSAAVAALIYLLDQK